MCVSTLNRGWREGGGRTKCPVPDEDQLQKAETAHHVVLKL